MALDNNQQALQLGRLYKIQSLGDAHISQDISAGLWIDDGEVFIYGSDSANKPASILDMTLEEEKAGGKSYFEGLTNYIAITQNTGITTEIVLSGVLAVDVGAIS